MAGGYPDGLRRGRPWCGTAPPTQLQCHSPTHAEFVTCNHTIEFTFRDAKQYWGLEDFMNVSAVAVTNAANLALFMVNVAYVLLRELRQTHPEASVLDLKARWRGYKYVEETLKLLPEMPEAIVVEQILSKVASLGSIHAADPYFSPS